MTGKREKPEAIVTKPRQIEVLQGQGMPIADAVRQVGTTQQTYYRWRKLYGGMGRSQLTPLKELEKENQHLRRAVSDLTLDRLSLRCSRGGAAQAPKRVLKSLGQGDEALAAEHDMGVFEAGMGQPEMIEPVRERRTCDGDTGLSCLTSAPVGQI